MKQTVQMCITSYLHCKKNKSMSCPEKQKCLLKQGCSQKFKNTKITSHPSAHLTLKNINKLKQITQITYIFFFS